MMCERITPTTEPPLMFLAALLFFIFFLLIIKLLFKCQSVNKTVLLVSK